MIPDRRSAKKDRCEIELATTQHHEAIVAARLLINGVRRLPIADDTLAVPELEHENVPEKRSIPTATSDELRVETPRMRAIDQPRVVAGFEDAVMKDFAQRTL